jgi:hypothetical protein
MTTKHTIATISLALVAFVFGCVTEALVVPPVHANPNAARWEYHCITETGYSGTETMQEDFNKLGREGWELAAAEGARFCFKRPLP